MLITHDLGVVAGMTERIQRHVRRLHRRDRHDRRAVRPPVATPTRSGLLHSIPRLDEREGRELIPIEGLPPDLTPAAGRLPVRAALRLAIDRCWTDNPVAGAGRAGRPAS